MRESFARISALTGRNLKEIIREPLAVILTIGLPLVMEVIFYFIFHGLTPQFEMRYLAPGIVVFSESFLTLFVGLLIATDRNTAFLTRLYVSGARSFEFIIAYALSIMPMVAVQSVLFFVVGGVIDPSIFRAEMVGAVLLSILTSLFYIALGIFLGSICSEKSIGSVASIVISGQSVLSGMWFPTEGLSGGFVTTMNVLPFKNATMLVQNALNGVVGRFDDIVLPLLIVLAYTIAAFVLAVVVFGNKMKAK